VTALDGRTTRREWFVLAGFALSGACGRKKGSGFPGYVLIATSGENSLAVVDLTTFRLQKPIPLGARPTAVVPAGPGNHTFVLTPSTGTVHLLDASLKVLRSGRLADELSDIRVTPDGKRLLAISGSRRELIEADATSLVVVTRHQLEASPIALDIAPGPFAAVSTGEHGTVELFHLETRQHWRSRIPGRVGAVRFRADGQRLLVANLQGRALTALAVPALEVIAELPLAMQPENLCFNSDEGQLFVSGDGADGIAIVFPYSPFAVDETVLAGRDPGVMACSASPAYLFVGSNIGSDVCILSIDTRKVIGIVDVGQRPTYITVTPDSQYALVLDETANALAVIHIPAIRANRNKTGASLFTVLAVGDKPVHAAVVPRSA
jgi:DNA-binding beta-propeller fold protein YncE